jgi:antitoxin PrlF
VATTMRKVRRTQRKATQNSTTTTTIGSRGQVTIPANVREPPPVRTGDGVGSVQIGPGKSPGAAADRCPTALKGMFGKAAKTVSIDDMYSAIAAKGSSAR